MPREGGSHTERLSSLILEDMVEVSGPFQTLTGGKYVKWVTLQMQGICLPVCSFTTRHRGREREVFSSVLATPWHIMDIRKKYLSTELLKTEYRF